MPLPSNCRLLFQRHVGRCLGGPKRANIVAMKAHNFSATAHKVGDQHFAVQKESSLGGVGPHIGGSSLEGAGPHVGFPTESPPVMDAEFVANITNQMNTIKNSVDQRFNPVEQRINAGEQRVNVIDSQHANIEARQTNVVARDHEDPIRVITGPDGQNPPEALFPNTYGQLLAMGPRPCRQLLLFYGLPANPRANRNQRLRKFLGAK
jgi:hypothetical protein